MSEQKRHRTPYSELPDEEKKRRNARKRILAAEKRTREAQLLPVEIQEIYDSPHVIEQESFILNHTKQRGNDDHPSTSGSGFPIGCSSEFAGQLCMLYDVNIGIVADELMPGTTLRSNPIPTEPYRLPSATPCSSCAAKRFPYETPTFCCYKGEVSLYPTVIPDQLQHLYSGESPQSLHFLQYILPYNSAFSFTSLGVHPDTELAKRYNGIYTFRAQGQIYHYIQSLYPSGHAPAHLQLYFYDTEHEVANRKGLKDKLQTPIIEQLINVLEANPYSKFFRSLRQISDLDKYQIRLKADPKVPNSTTNTPVVSQVAAIWLENEDTGELQERDIVVQKHDGHSQSIRYYFGLYDPLQYPLLFPSGEPGWHQGIQKRKGHTRSQPSLGQGKVLPMHSANANDLIATEASVYDENAEKPNMVSPREYYAYCFQIRPSTNSILLQSGRLLQQFAVDMYVKIETSRLNYFRNNQDKIRADVYQGIVDSISQGEVEGSRIGKRIVLPSSFIGGPRDMRRRYMDAMALVERYGKPDLFLTMTCNPSWPEIMDELRPHEEAQNRPDLLTRIFHSKFEHLRKEVIKKELFGPVAAYTFVIEFQKRGLPHVHMLIILKNAYKLNTAAKFDQFISAELPNKVQHPHLYAMVLRHMMHGPCGDFNKAKPCMHVNGSCKDQYPRAYTEETVVAEDGYPVYKRRCTNEKVKVRGHMLDNAWVVPHNPFLLAMFDCHINVEVCSTIKAVKYLYKYIYKGHDKITYRLVDARANADLNEIEQYQSARWISPPEAIWRIFSFPMHQIYPAVISLQLHLQDCQLINFKDNSNLQNIISSNFSSRTMLTQFFWMNRCNERAKTLRLLYKNFPEEFVWVATSRIWKEREKQEVIGRVITASPGEGERYYLRLLLSHIRAPTSYESLRTVGNIMYDSYREAAIKHGLLEDDHTNEKCMQEASAYQMPSSLRQLFCTILVHCSPVNPTELFLKFEQNMIEDYVSLQRILPTAARQILLDALDSELQSMGKNLTHYQLDHLITAKAKTSQVPKEIQDEMNIAISAVDLASVSLLNEEQTNAYNQIIDAVINDKGKCFFIDGPGGTGKTFLYRAILATIRSQGKIALATASSGVAASILPNGRTAHSRFKIPIETKSKLSCNVKKQSGLAALLKKAALIIWDEASMAKKHSIQAVDNLLRDLTGNDQLFGGKVVVLGGDFRQVLPVIPRGNKEDCMNASLVRSYIWESLEKLKLKQNMRAREDPAFSEYILRIGNGIEKENSKNQIRLTPSLVLRSKPGLETLEQLSNFVFPTIDSYATDPLSLTTAAILTPKNDAVDQINEMLISKFPGREEMYLSFDQTTDPDQQGMYEDFLNSVSPQGLPPHRLVLKENSPILLLRNINPSKGLCNGTRLICKKFEKHMITAQIAVGENKGTMVFIPRIPLQPNDAKQYPVQFTRRQFPVRLCFAMTINKAQGQTLTKVGLYLPEPVFSHGQFYVGISRATTALNIKIQLGNSEEDLASFYHTKNIVYKELLAEANCE